MQYSPDYIENWLRGKLPPEKKEVSLEYLSEEFPWYPMVHLLRAVNHKEDKELLQKAALYQHDVLRLHIWLNDEKEVWSKPEDLHTANPGNELTEPKTTDNFIGAEPEIAITETENKGTETATGIELPENKTSNIFIDAEVILPETEVESEWDETENQSELMEIQPEIEVLPEEQEVVQHATTVDEPEKEKIEVMIPKEYSESITAETIEAIVSPNDKTLSWVENKEIPLPPAPDDLMPITPYYTVDYFASQGIKIEKKVSLEPDTQLDQQVKSFTEWLKSMKKLKFQPQTTYSDPLVEANAKASLIKNEIVTEAMAEVWAKQGNLHMAAQVYAKLMLLHPEKTPYFAARLQELKQIQ